MGGKVRIVERKLLCFVVLFAQLRSRTIRYVIEANLAAGVTTVELWRKNDHDTLTFDTSAGTWAGSRQHWMTGECPFARELGFHEPLHEMLPRWLQSATPVLADSERLWRVPGTCSGQQDGSEDVPPRTNLLYFLAPSADCTELLVNATIPFVTHLERVLIDSEGRPIRAAMVGSQECKEYVEEYDVKLEILADTHGAAE